MKSLTIFLFAFVFIAAQNYGGLGTFAKSIDVDKLLDIFGDDFLFDMPRLWDVYKVDGATSSTQLLKDSLLRASGEFGQLIENCGSKEHGFKLSWSPSGPLKAGSTYSVTFESTAAMDIDQTALMSPEIYHDGNRINPYLINIPYCRFIRRYKEFYDALCGRIRKGDTLHVGGTGTIPSQLKPGRYHGNVNIHTRDGEPILCIAFSVMLD